MSTLPLDELLVEHLQLGSGQRCLVLAQGLSLPARALAAAYPAVAVDVIEIDFPSQRLLRQQGEREALSNLALIDDNQSTFPDAPTPGVNYENVVIIMPKGRLLARRWLTQAANILPAGGQLALAGPKDMGIQSVAKDAEALFGEKGSVLGYKKGQRVIGFTRPALLPDAPDWAAQPGILPDTWAIVEADTPAGRLTLKTLPGVFAFDGLDEGTQLLLENLVVREDDEVLDLGCGTGIIGIFAARRGASRVEMVDSNLLAVAAARRNIADLGLEKARAYAGDALSETSDSKFSLIASNPPFHSGKAVDYQAAEAFIRQGRQSLLPRGRMVIVANRFIRYERIMTGLFTKVETLAATNRFHVLCGSV